MSITPSGHPHHSPLPQPPIQFNSAWPATPSGPATSAAQAVETNGQTNPSQQQHQHQHQHQQSLPPAQAQAQAQGPATQLPPPQASHPPPPPPPLHRFPLPGLSLPTDFQPILQDHHAVLYPNYSTSFASVQDVIARLLPWHVWQVPEDIVALAKDKHFVAPGSHKGKQKAIESTLIGPATDGLPTSHSSESLRPAKRSKTRPKIEYGKDLAVVPRIQRAAASDQAVFERIHGLAFPDIDELEDIIPRYHSIHSRIRHIRHRAEGGQASCDTAAQQQDDTQTAPALFARESHLQLLRQFHTDEKAELDGLLAELKQARFNVMAQYGGIWQTELDKIAPGVPQIQRDELYNPPAPSPPPEPRPRQPTQPQPVAPPPAPAAAANLPKPSPAATSTATSRAQSTEKQQSGEAGPSKGKGKSPPVSKSKSQSPARQASPASASNSKSRKRSSAAATPRQSTSGASQNPTPQPGLQAPPRPQIPPPAAFPSPHLPLHMQHQYTQQWVSPPPAPSAGAPPPPRPMPNGPVLPMAQPQGGVPMPQPQPIAGPSVPSAPANGAAPGVQMPIRVVLPLNLIQMLTEAGIAPQPAPHLKPAIEAHKRRAAQAAASGTSAPPLVCTGAEGEDSPTGGYSTAPCDPDPNQTYAAVLLGITEATLPGNQAERYQLVHLSLKLDQLEPNQLQSLAAAVNMVQGQQTTGVAAPGLGAPVPAPVMGMQQQQQQVRPPPGQTTRPQQPQPQPQQQQQQQQQQQSQPAPKQ